MSEESQAPGKAWGLRKPWKGIYRQASQEALNNSVSCITCPASRKRGPSRCVLQLLGVEYHPASLETDSESLFTPPGTAGG